MNITIKKLIYPIYTTVAIFGLWEFLILCLGVPDYVLPSPMIIIKKFFSILDLLWVHSLVTLSETLLGIGLAIIFAITLSIALVWSRTLELALLPVLEFIQGTPKLAMAPLFLVWFGFGIETKIFLSFWAAYFPLTITTISGLKDVQPNMINLSRSMSATDLQTFTKIRFPNSLPYFFNGLKLACFSGMLGALVGEFIGSSKGLGFLIIMAQHNADVVLLFAIIVCTSILSKLLYSLVVWIERRTIPWHVMMRGESAQIFTE